MMSLVMSSYHAAPCCRGVFDEGYGAMLPSSDESCALGTLKCGCGFTHSVLGSLVGAWRRQ